jgi:hypothetical protein
MAFVPQQYRTAIEAPREFGKASGAMLGAQSVLLALDNILAQLTGEAQISVINYDTDQEIMPMIDEAVSCQTQSLAKLEKIKMLLRDH